MLAAGFAIGFVVFAPAHPAFAQAWPSQGQQTDDDEADDSAKADETKSAETKPGETRPAEASEQKPTEAAEIDANSLDWSQLNLDPATLTYGPKAPARSATTEGDMKWSNNNNKQNGTA